MTHATATPDYSAELARIDEIGAVMAKSFQHGRMCGAAEAANWLRKQGYDEAALALVMRSPMLAATDSD